MAKAYRDPIFSSRSYERIIEPVFGRSLLQMDGKEHARKRALVTPYFRGKGLEAWHGVITRNAVAILGDATAGAAEHLASRFEPGQTIDIVEEFCNYLPVFVITEMLGLPRSDYPRFKGWYTAHTNFVGAFGSDPEIDRIGRAATAELWEYLTPIIAERRANPASDLISTLVTAEVDGEMFDDIEVKTHITQLLNAGSETTGKALASMIALVLERREYFEEMRQDRSKVTAAISEALRYIPPSQMNSRQVTEDVELHGQFIPAGSLVVLLIASANRDERRFDHADVFDPRRTDLDHEKVFNNTGEHFAFGGGRHFCLGAMLARSEIEVGMNLLMDRFPNMRVAEGFTPSWTGVKARYQPKLLLTL
ncbi:cytochrome P450 [Mycolicibacterium vinylchloridicum]|uniref:cytochrome P450 n=1 Tax=Mycolicibacterium vinylchloridicum TaxID=2736928 RepID=UPI0015C6E112|nr:cytochrome P450 [Mycolicibacterium vinylchloridicum]